MKCFEKVLDQAHVVRTDLVLRARTTTIEDSYLETVLTARLWIAFGYEKLGDYLRVELGLPEDRVLDWLATAIRRGLESGVLYGLPEPV